MKKIKLLAFIGILISISFVSVMGQTSENKLILGGTYFFEEELLNKLADYLTEELERTVEVKIYEKTSHLHDDMDKHVPDILFMNSYGYVYGHAKYPDYTAFSALGRNGNPDSYKSCIIVSAEAQYKNLDDLIEDASNVDLRFVHATSTSGHIVPRYELRKRDITQAEASFKNIDFAGSHKDAIMAVINGTATAAACGLPSLEYCIEQGNLKKDQYRILWKSHEIQGAPVVYNTELDTDTKEQIKKAFLKMAQKDPDAYKFVQNTFHADMKSQFISVNDSQYDVIRSMASSMEDLILFLNFYMQ